MQSPSPRPAVTRRRTLPVLRWIDSWAHSERAEERGDRSIDWMRVVPFLGLHLSCLAVIWVGWSWFAVATAAALYAVRMFAITAFYHRYFSHKTFRTGRKRQFLFALLGNTAVQRGPLWWAAHHREHHSGADTSDDPHSPSRRGFWWSHVGWILTRTNFRTRVERVRDLARYPELCFLDRFDTLVPVLFFAALFGLGALLEVAAPSLGTSGAQMLVWGLISTVVLFHATFTINSLAHQFGSRRYETRDTSRNNFWLALLTFGEGWHNNHHHYSSSARQGFHWWELDPSWWGLLAMRALGLVWDLKPVPAHVLVNDRRRS